METINWKSGNFFTSLLAVQFITNIMVLLNIPIARQVIGFLFLTLIPGIILLRILQLDELDIAEVVLFSVGLSIAFLMLIGVFVNELLPLIGISKPLSLVPLMIILNGIILLLYVASYVKDKNFRVSVTESIKLHPSTLLSLCLPLLTVIGALSVNASPSNNFVLLLMIITISVFIVLITFSEKLVPPQTYPLVLLMIAIALLLHASLISNHINGWDVQTEYFFFNLTKSGSHWLSTIPGRINAMLSVTILPSIYSSILNMEGVWIFKIIYPLIFSLVPLGLYKLWQMWVSKKVAFLSAFFFMANGVFFTEMLGLGRQMIAELFYILLFFVLLNKKMTPIKKTTCFLIFSFALVVSHYSTSYIFMFLIFFAWLSLFFLKNKGRSITTSLVVIFFTMLFSWYIYVSASGPFYAIVDVGNHIYRSIFVEFFNPGSRGEMVLRGLGMESPPSLWHLIGRIFAYATEFFIVVGFILLITKRKKIFDKESIVISSLNMALLVMCILLPHFARALNITRFYHIQLFFLAPLFILGGKTLFGLISPFKTEFYGLVLVLIVLVPFFLFQTNLVYEVTGDESWSIPLSKYRMDAIQYSGLAVIDEQDVFGANWLSRNINSERTSIYADVISKTLILEGGYGMLYDGGIIELANTTTVLANGIIYLRRVNVVFGTLLSLQEGGKNYWNISEISYIINNTDKIYSNGGCEIYQG